MTLSKLASLLTKVQNSGYPAVFRTPDGKIWEAEKIVSTSLVDDSDFDAKTEIQPKEIKA